MSADDRWFAPRVASTPINTEKGDGSEDNASNVSGHSRRRGRLPPKRRSETGTEVLVGGAKRIQASAASSRTIDTPKSGNNNATKRKKKKNIARLVAAEIRYLRRTTHPLVRRASFARVVRSIAQRMDFEIALEIRWQAMALDCLQEAAEAFMVDFFSFAARAAAHAHRVTVMLADIHFISQFYHMLR